MKPETAEVLADLDRRIAEQETAGDRAAAAELCGRKAMVYYVEADWPAAAAEFDHAARLAAEDDQLGPQAQARYSQGLALENDAARRADALAAFAEAARLFGLANHHGMEAKARQRMATLQAQAGDLDRAVAEATAAIDRAAEPSLKIELYRGRATLLWLGGRLEPALADLGRALDLAQASGDADLALRIQVEQRSLQGELGDGAGGNPFAALFQAARSAGNLQLMSDLQLNQAASYLAAGKYAEAEREADAARQSALRSDDLMRYARYALACVVIAVARDQRGDRAGVIAILLTCKVSLERDLGKPVGQQITVLLDTLAARWGQAAFQQALQAYRRRMGSDQV